MPKSKKVLKKNERSTSQKHRNWHENVFKGQIFRQSEHKKYHLIKEKGIHEFILTNKQGGGKRRLFFIKGPNMDDVLELETHYNP